MHKSKVIFLTGTALFAFAGNSILNRLALGSGAIDALSFSALRLVSGAAVLLLILVVSRKSIRPVRGSWTGSAALLIYMVTFSLAYRQLATGTGALILFATVQIVMVGTALVLGQRMRLLGWLGFSLAVTGFLLYILPGLQSPSWQALGLMILAGAGWAVYSLLGRKSTDPLLDTTGNFVRTLPFIPLLLAWPSTSISAMGAVLAIISGALMSGIGYAIWYQALRQLSSIQAAMSQLLVPVLAAIAGLIWLQEAIGAQLVLAGAMILGGIALHALSSQTKDLAGDQK
jgi:drug/metabolite transporter (DMT)-like permease